MIALLGVLVAIVFVDLSLSGDNMLIIGAAVAGVPRHQRRLAMIFGGGGAIVLRIGFTAGATLLLQFPLLQAIGGVVVVYVTIQLLIDRSNKQLIDSIEHPEAASTKTPANRRFLQLLLPIFLPLVGPFLRKLTLRTNRSLLKLLLRILLADVTTSLDNILAIAALARGNVPVLVIGLALSVAILLLGSILIAELIERFPLLLDVSSLILAWTAAQMFLNDKTLGTLLDRLPWTKIVITVTIFAIVIAADIYLRLREKQQKNKKQSTLQGAVSRTEIFSGELSEHPQTEEL